MPRDMTKRRASNKASYERHREVTNARRRQRRAERRHDTPAPDPDQTPGNTAIMLIFDVLNIHRERLEALEAENASLRDFIADQNQKIATLKRQNAIDRSQSPTSNILSWFRKAA